VHILDVVGSRRRYDQIEEVKWSQLRPDDCSLGASSVFAAAGLRGKVGLNAEDRLARV